MRRATGKLWLDTFFARKTTDKTPNQNLSGQTVIFTGGTDGMGRIAVERFAEMGANICLFARTPDKAQSVIETLVARGDAGDFRIIQCDIGDLSQVRLAAETVMSLYGQVDYLINCAGANIADRRLSPDGFEMNFTINYLGPYLLTELLFEHLKASGTSRIINLKSATQEVAKLRFDDLQLTQNWSMLNSYAQAKLCVVMHTRDLARRLKGTDVTVNSLNPGYIKTNLLRHSKSGYEALFMKLFGRLASPTWVGGERIIAAALSDEFRQHLGAYIYEDMLHSPNREALDDEKVARLMDISEDMVAPVLS